MSVTICSVQYCKPTTAEYSIVGYSAYNAVDPSLYTYKISSQANPVSHCQPQQLYPHDILLSYTVTTNYSIIIL